LHCDEFIPCQQHKRPSHLTKKQQVEREAFKEIIALLEANNIIYWIDCGTCLGAYRYGGIIPWDIDIDIAIFPSDHDNVKRLLSSMDPEKYQSRIGPVIANRTPFSNYISRDEKPHRYIPL